MNKLTLNNRKGGQPSVEKTTNGTFDANVTGWVAGFDVTTSTFTWSAGTAVLTQAGADTTPRYVHTISNCVLGQRYEVRATLTASTGTGDKFLIFTDGSSGTGGSSQIYSAIPQTVTIRAIATATTMYVALCNNNASAGATATWDNVSVRAI